MCNKSSRPLFIYCCNLKVLMILLFAVCTAGSIRAQETVEGVVISADRKPLPGVSVTEKGTSNATTTKDDGSFRIAVFGGEAVLVIQYLGFEDKEVPVTGQPNMTIVLEPDVTAMDEVVVVGYGTIRKSDLTGAVSRISTEKINDRPVTSVEQFLQGQVPGVQITQNTGAPGGGISFLVRGATSLSGSNQPLIVIDGYPVDSDNSAIRAADGSQSGYLGELPPDNALAGLNPADIESVEILKDASATAIYGSRGANGVILITTRQGKSGRDRIEYSFRYDMGKIPRKINVLNTGDYINYSNEAYTNSGQDPVYPDEEIPGLLGTNYDWQDLIYRTSGTQNHQLSFSGSSDRMNYAVIMGYLDQEGVVLNSRFNRGSLRVNLDREISSRFRAGLNLSGTMSNNKAAMQSSNRNDPSTSVVHGALMSRPLDSPLTPEDEIDQSYVGNPLTLVTLADDQNKVTTLLANLHAEYTFAEGLTFRARGGVNNTASQRDLYHPRGTTLGDLQGGYAYRGHIRSFNYLTEFTLNLNRTFNKIHRVNAVAGYTWQEWERQDFSINAMDFPNDNQLYYNLSAANTVSKPLTSTTKWALASYLARVNYTFDDRYLLTFTGRADGSTRLANGSKWQFFPSVALGWNLHHEGFMESADWISGIKLRASYGLSGNQTIAVGATQGMLTPSTGVVGGEVRTGYLLANMPNNSLHWETTRQTNLGLDLELSKISFGFDYYLKRSHDLLISMVIPPSNGFVNFNTNVGIVDNRGYEVSLSIRELTGRVFQWDINGNFSVNRNEIRDLGSVHSFVGPTLGTVGGQSMHIARVGSPIGAIYGYGITGIYQNEDEVAAGPGDPAATSPGSFKFRDMNDDGVISADDREIIGDPYPDFIFGLMNNWSYKGFSLSVFLQGSVGQDVINANRYYLDGLGRGIQSNVREEAYDNRWTGEGSSNTYPQATASADPFQSRFSDFIVEDASYMRVKNVTLSYDFRSGVIPGVRNMRLFFSTDNLFTFTGYSGYDPEINSKGGHAMMPGVDNGSIPQYRTFSLGINVGF